MEKIYKYYDCHKKLIGILVDAIYSISMTLVIFLRHDSKGFSQTHSYRLFISMFMAFGIWSYEMKKQSIKEMAIDLGTKFVSIFIAAIIISKFKNGFELHDLYGSVLYPAFTSFIYFIMNKKYNWKINNQNKKMTASEYCLERFGRNASVLPKVFILGGIILPGIFNASVKMFILSIFLSFIAENAVIMYYSKKLKT